MAQFTITYPGAHTAQIVAALTLDLENQGVDTSRLNGAQIAQKWVARTVRQRLILYRRLNDATITAAVVAAQDSRTTASVAAAAAEVARKSAETNDQDQIIADFAGDV